MPNTGYGEDEAAVLFVKEFPFVQFIKQIAPEEKFIYINDRVENLIGITAEQHYNDPDIAKRRLTKDSRERYEQVKRDLDRDDIIPIRLTWKHKMGGTVTTEHYLHRIEQNGKIWILGLVRDITDEDGTSPIPEKIQRMMSVCSYCRSIFDDSSWREMEEFIAEHFFSELTHGICDKCYYIITQSMESDLEDIELETDTMSKEDFLIHQEKIKHKLTKMTLKRTEQRYETIFLKSPIPIIGQKNEKIVMANTAAARLLGFQSREAMLGINIEKVIAAKEYEKIRDRAVNREKGGDEPTEYFTTLRTQSGVTIEVYLKIANIELLKQGVVNFAYIIPADTDTYSFDSINSQ